MPRSCNTHFSFTSRQCRCHRGLSNPKHPVLSCTVHTQSAPSFPTRPLLLLLSQAASPPYPSLPLRLIESSPFKAPHTQLPQCPFVPPRTPFLRKHPSQRPLRIDVGSKAAGAVPVITHTSRSPETLPCRAQSAATLATASPLPSVAGLTFPLSIVELQVVPFQTSIVAFADVVFTLALAKEIFCPLFASPEQYIDLRQFSYEPRH